jgi:hypothetical protein
MHSKAGDGHLCMAVRVRRGMCMHAPWSCASARIQGMGEGLIWGCLWGMIHSRDTEYIMLHMQPPDFALYARPAFDGWID